MEIVDKVTLLQKQETSVILSGFTVIYQNLGLLQAVQAVLQNIVKTILNHT